MQIADSWKRVLESIFIYEQSSPHLFGGVFAYFAAYAAEALALQEIFH